jgi:alkanesulfonate monooxygenase SsuD/methylene tetrahydromethanopterin reductase-like flavin-dependent oxidoreductase (luciferase family)
MSIWSRTPAPQAMTAATLHDVSHGRLILGLGASTRTLTEGFHARPFTRPAAALRDTVVSIRALLNGEPAQSANGVRPIRLGLPAQRNLPIWLGALGPRTIQLTAEVADGWLPIFLTAPCLRERRAELVQVRQPGGLQPLVVATGPICMVDADPEVARQTVASLLVWYLSAMGEVYPRVVAQQGYASAVESIHAANPRAKPNAAATISKQAQPLVDAFTLSGAGGEVRHGLSAWDDAVDITLVCLPPGLTWPTLEATLRAGAP